MLQKTQTNFLANPTKEIYGKGVREQALQRWAASVQI